MGMFVECGVLKTNTARELWNEADFSGILGHSAIMQSVFALLRQVMPTDVRVLISGESGTGKECIARAIHDGSPRQQGPFVAVDCGALPANLLESELFGYVKGAFTGADRDRKGLFEEAHGGTLFLDEIVNMPMELQAKLLRAIQESEIRPLGSSQVRKVNARIIAAASESVRDEMIAGKFRRDLFYRLNVVNINLPALRERKEDIPILAEHFLSAMNKKYGKHLKGFHADTMPHLEAYAWPGNIRELEHAMERAVVLCQSEQLRQTDFPFFETPSAAGNTLFQPRPWDEAIFELKRQYLANVLKYTGGAKKQAAEILQIQPTYLSRLLKNLRVEE
ncbi:sigma-54-dependent Fis family transcriptional regulator [candidate division KSB1 bacterium]|nr:MAG: sigma-54-dependent Fis family transcriptional regulator [candidate division KSB1 bacterium]MCE7944688.1 sigma-54-dependent Fis family transcriptional regulator [Chlorobi bacterium CHB1]MDL1873751.1 sigma-54-dependent Fis family transcriptional regulator [Cytophagia bacterium CHB2]